MQSHLPVKLRSDFMWNDIEAFWVQVHLPHLKPIFVGCCYRPLDADADFLNELCEMIDRVSDMNSEIYLLGDISIDWIADNCPSKTTI